MRSLSSFSDVSHYFASLGTFSVCFQNVKTNNCIMFMQPLVRCVQNIHKDVNDKITPTHAQTHALGIERRLKIQCRAFCVRFACGLVLYWNIVHTIRITSVSVRLKHRRAAPLFASRTVVARAGINKSEFSVVKQLPLNMDGVVNHKRNNILSFWCNFFLCFFFA